MASEDLRKFMYDDLPDNINEINAKFKENLTITTPGLVQQRASKERIPFSDPLKKELAKYRPVDRERKRGLAIFAMAFSALGISAWIILPTPLNWIMAAGCTIPFVVPLFRYRIMRHV